MVVDRPEARTAAWYEFFPRSAEGRAIAVPSCAIVCPGSNTPKQWDLTSSISRRSIPSVHQPQRTKQFCHSRTGRSRRALCHWQPNLGCRTGGHKDIDPASARWRISPGWKRKSANAGWKSRSISQSIARPIIPTCAEHPEWFYERPDGTIKFAENPPKKYEDIYPLNFRCAELAGALGGNEEHHFVLGGARRPHFPGG